MSGMKLKRIKPGLACLAWSQRKLSMWRQYVVEHRVARSQERGGMNHVVTLGAANS